VTFVLGASLRFHFPSINFLLTMPPRKESFRRRHPILIRALLLSLTFVIAIGAGLAYGAWALVCRGGQCPPVDSLNDYTPRQTSKLYAADGRFIAELGRTLVKIDEIPQTVQQAFVITEDKRFFSHAGIDGLRVVGALVRDILARSWDQGFSTITMQLARNVFPERISREKTLVRKIKEGKVAREIERKFDKKKILELYLNQINLGNGAYGVETAAQRYFGKSVRDLNIAEAATLAALPKAPERYNPKRHPERAIQRRSSPAKPTQVTRPHTSWNGFASSSTSSSVASFTSRDSEFTRRSTSTCS
jgi:penicillin-binding protein 1A